MGSLGTWSRCCRLFRRHLRVRLADTRQRRASCSRYAPRGWGGVFGRQDCADREAKCSLKPKRPRDPNQQYPRPLFPSGQHPCHAGPTRHWRKFGAKLMSALGQKQTFAPQKAMSALHPKADIRSAKTNAALCQKRTNAPQQTASLRSLGESKELRRLQAVLNLHSFG